MRKCHGHDKLPGRPITIATSRVVLDRTDRLSTLNLRLCGNGSLSTRTGVVAMAVSSDPSYPCFLHTQLDIRLVYMRCQCPKQYLS